MNFSLLFKKRTFNRLVCLLISIITYCCIDPLEPIFDFQSDIVIINGLASTTPGSTSVKVEKTKIEFGDYVSEFISGCRVRLINSLTKEEVNKAYIKIQKKIHPDISPETSRLSSLVNEAKEIVLRDIG